MLIPNKNTPRWLIFLIDLVICVVAFAVAYLLRFEFNPPQIEIDLAIRFFPIFLAVRALSFFLGKTYAGIIRYTSTQDAQRIFITILGGSLVFVIANQLRYSVFDGIYFIPNSVIAIDFLMTLFAMIASRILVKVVYLELKSPVRSKKNVVIYGAGEAGLITKQAIDRDLESGVNVIAFIDDEKNKSGKKIEGASIYHSSKAEEFFSQGKVDEMIISIQNLGPERKAMMIDLALAYDVKVLNVPPVRKWINGELSLRQLREIRIEDLLGRSAIKLDNPEVRKMLHGKKVLVTGAAGSIGSELVRQIAAYEPEHLILFDQAESPLYDIEFEMKAMGTASFCSFVIGDVRQEDRVRRLMEAYQPEIVFHAAAYKHVPLMEVNPTEAILANVLGTKNVADQAVKHKVERFVLISTDKAVNPTSVMGASKRAAEIYCQSLNAQSETSFITTRFGNVLGSNGSVIPLFKRQIEAGGPITVTHPEVTRFFMTIPEAVELVLEAGVMGAGGEIFLFDMGESVRIMDLAKKMIRLSGLELGKDIEIKITGLRPGEKLYEELLANEEDTLATHHSKILKAKVREYPFEAVKLEIESLVALFSAQDNQALVSKLKSIVPEYKSENSEFKSLDVQAASSSKSED
ncbi:polysaccharide biosynthesis protein [Sanyastnella coralliicola]|uniref:polysaccharide biosynthesis protein n=1 Tax=Sanyastnella coralliicola TaxID=3069118 RepID=UPI0027BA5668|nr:nucleoside-diphosphate sugar epimerase/dehydratase [Longitalea sp. SCSIO 12813]